ncbi:histidine kinase dimerization/phospho-acceptor domain-containing protein [Streptomyces sp. NPDC056921]|uniref:histidine kinase dimerization/phospho-acceptor domain-containing protein n=1 Tax=Streptomyces sp. NPDC056921 TaxID=3345966 RepID=UPI0036264907
MAYRGLGRRGGPPSRGRPAELASLAGSPDELLDQLAAVLQHERQLSAELSHELRTPLARITAETDGLTARPRTPAEQHTAHEAIASAAAEMRRICETLLTDAQAAATQAGRPVPRGVTCWTSRGLWHAAPAWNTRLPRPSPSAAPPWRRGSPRPSSSPDPPLLDNGHRYVARSGWSAYDARTALRCAWTTTAPASRPLWRIGLRSGSARRPRRQPPGRRARPAAGPAPGPRGDITPADAPGPLGGARFMVTLPAG